MRGLLLYYASMLYENEYFESSNLSLVGTLCVFGAAIEGVNRNDGHRAIFYIKHEKGLERLVQAFYARELKVEPLAYYNALRDVKSRLYATPIE